MIAAAAIAATHRCWESELIEHLACHAAEVGDTLLEGLCDSALAGETDEQVVLAVVRDDPRLTEVAQRGLELGWRTRPAVAS